MPAEQHDSSQLSSMIIACSEVGLRMGAQKGTLLTPELTVKMWVFVSVYPETQGAVGTLGSSCSLLGAAWISEKQNKEYLLQLIITAIL